MSSSIRTSLSRVTGIRSLYGRGSGSAPSPRRLQRQHRQKIVDVKKSGVRSQKSEIECQMMAYSDFCLPRLLPSPTAVRYGLLSNTIPVAIQ